MQISGPWWRWYVTWMVVRCRYQDMGWGETQPWWMAWLEVRQGIDRDAPYIFTPGWRWDVTWIEVTHEYQDLDGVETLSGGRGDVTLWTWIGLRQYMYGGETKIFGPGSRWDRTWMEVRHISWILDGVVGMLIWSWDAILGAWMEVRRHMDGDETQT